ncbi:MAG: transposase, partial [Bacilli bacterium]
MSKYLNKLGYKLAKVKKTKPLKKIQETDIIFENVNHVKEIYRNDDDTVMISIDAKDRVKIGGFSRKGLSRIEVNALDHDFNSEYVTPFGILDMKTNEVNLYNTKSKVTADYIIDVIIDFWKEKEYDKSKKKLVIFSDNGPENSSRRSRFIYRLVLMADTYNIEIEMVYYPPYHSKYNAIERVWARLENMWNGSLIDTIDTCINYMRNLTWNKVKSNVKLILKEYQIGIKENKQTLLNIEKYITRKKGIEKWAFSISN